MSRTALALACLSLATPGCYLAHERGTPDRGSLADADDTTRGDRVPDSGVRSRDAGTSFVRDGGGMDAGPLLPPEPDPDLGPDARPSDYADAGTGAGGWSDPPVIGPDDPCCTLGDPIRVTGRPEVGLSQFPPSIAWGPNRWGLLSTQEQYPEDGLPPRAVVFELAPDGTPIGDLHALDHATEQAGAIAWAEGRWAIAISREAHEGLDHPWFAALFDRDLRRATDWTDVGGGSSIALANLTTGHRWLAARSDTTLFVTPFSETGGVEPPVSEPAAARMLHATTLRSRVAVLAESFSATPSELVVIGPGPDYAILGRTAMPSAYGIQSALGALRDLVVVATMRDGQVFSQVIDPFAHRLVGTERSLGPAALPSFPAIDVAGASKAGVAGVCWVRHQDDTSDPSMLHAAIDFRLVGLDGAPVGTAVNVIDSTFRGALGDCAVGTDELGFLVAWWDGSSLWVRRVYVANR